MESGARVHGSLDKEHTETVGKICLFVCVNSSTMKSPEHVGLRKEKLQYDEFVGLPNKLSLNQKLLFPQDHRVNIFIINNKKVINFFVPTTGTYSSALIYWKRRNLCSIVKWYNFKMADS